MNEKSKKNSVERQIMWSKYAAWISVGAGFFAAFWSYRHFNLTTDEGFARWGSFLQGAVGSVWSLAAFLFVYVAFLGQKQQIFLQYEQLKTEQEASKGQSLIGLIQYLQAEEVRRARNLVFKTLKAKPYSDWDTDERTEAATACAAYGTAGVLIRAKTVDLDVIIENWGPSIMDVVTICQPLIDDLRKEKGEKYWAALLWLSKQASGRLGQISAPTQVSAQTSLAKQNL